MAWLSAVRVLNRKKLLSSLTFTRYGSGYCVVSMQSMVIERYYSCKILAFRIWDVYPESEFFHHLSQIPDPGSKRFRIPDPPKKFKYF
jgi:hypothetical protein